MIHEDEAKALGLLYHLNSEPCVLPSEYRQGPLTFKKIRSELPSVNLPRSGENSQLMETLLARRSCRLYRPGKLPLAALAEIVRGTYGMSLETNTFGQSAPPPRAVPSAGGCYPLELYLAAWAVESVEPGLYHYGVLDHGLEVMRLGDLRGEIRGLLAGQAVVEDVCAFLFFAAVFERTLAKYGARGYRYVLLEAGHAAQNTCLIATELGLGSLCLGGFFDARLNRFLGLDGITEAVLYSVAVGYPAE